MKRKNIEVSESSREKIRRDEEEVGGGDGGDGGGGEPWQNQAGMILQIKLRNFMCHQEFVYSPNLRLNFLCGANGSGKSAILTAIVFALGGTARMSNRGSSNKGFVRVGQSTASVEIKLLNVGEFAYKPEVYGDTITITRTISVSGSGSYKLSDDFGKPVAVKRVKDEINRMLSMFGIQVWNPVAVLNQDTSKTFLHSCDSGKLYEFFMKATQLEDCKRDYNTAAEERNTSRRLMEEKVQSIPDLKRQLLAWEKKYEFHQTMAAKKDNIRVLKGELAWAMVNVAEGEVKETEKSVEITKKKMAKCDECIEELTEKLKSEKQEKLIVEKEIQSIAEGAKKRESKLSELKRTLKILKQEETATRRAFEDVERRLSTKETESRALEMELKRLRRSEQENEYENKRQLRLKKIQELEEELRSGEAQYQSTLNHINNLSHSVENCRREAKVIRDQLGAVRSKIADKKAEIKNMQKEKDNKFVVFGPEIPKLLQAIENNKRKFRKPPIGPLGAHISVRKDATEQEGILVEFEIGNLLRSFIVDNFDDKRELDKICSQLRIKANIITSKFADVVHDVSSGRVHSKEYKTILDTLVIDSPSVANVLIDQKKIEQVLLLPNDNVAQTLLSKKENVPKGLKHALTFNQFLKSVTNYFPAPNYRSYVISKIGSGGGGGGGGSGGKTLLRTSVEEHMTYLKEELKELQEKFSELQAKLEEKETGELAGHLKELKRHETVNQRLKPEIAKVNTEISKLKTQDHSEAPPDIVALEEDLDRIREESQNLKDELSRKKAEAEEAKVKADEEEKVYSVEKENHAKEANQSEPLEQRLSDIENRISKIAADRSYYTSKKESYQTSLSALQTELEERVKKTETQITKANQWSEERIQTTKKPEEIYRKISNAEDSIRRQEEVHEPREVVIKEYHRIKSIYETVTAQVKSLNSAVDFLTEMLEKRRKGFIAIRGSVSRNVKMAFAMRLSARKFVGELKFNHKANQLEIVVCPEGRNVKKRDMKTLSGGEKSYSTISLILALWDSMQPPFRILDEFDVFMDMMNRRIALDLIISYAKDSRKFQYIFLTPLNTDNIAIDEDVSILRLEKNQG